MKNRLPLAAVLMGSLAVFGAGLAFAHDAVFSEGGFGGDFHGQDSLNTANAAAQTFDSNHPVAAQDARNAAYNNGYGYGGGIGPDTSSSGGSGAAAQGAAAAASANSTGAGYTAGILVSPGSMPANAATVTANGVAYRYANGIFYQPSGSGFAVANPPVGASVSALPPDYIELSYGDSRPPLYYDPTYGAYYSQSGSAYSVVTPPKGTVVPSIPKEYQSSMVSGVQVDQYNGVIYRQFFSGGNIVYAVV